MFFVSFVFFELNLGVLLHGNIHVIMVVVLGYKLIGSHSGVKICRWTKVCRDSSRTGFSIMSKSQQNDVILSLFPEIIRKRYAFLMISGGMEITASF